MEKNILITFEKKITEFADKQINEIKKSENPDLSTYTSRLVAKWDILIKEICNEYGYNCDEIIKTPISQLSNRLILKTLTIDIYQNQSTRILNEIIK